LHGPSCSLWKDLISSPGQLSLWMVGGSSR